jgi:hypothetical protein
VAAAVTAAAVLVEEGGVIEEETGTEASKTPRGTRQRDVDEPVGRSDLYAAVADVR